MVVEVVAERGGFCDSTWFNSSNLARPVDGRRPGARLAEESSTRIDRERVRRLVNRGLFFFAAPASGSLPGFMAPTWRFLSLVEAPSFKGRRPLAKLQTDVVMQRTLTIFIFTRTRNKGGQVWTRAVQLRRH